METLAYKAICERINNESQRIALTALDELFDFIQDFNVETSAYPRSNTFDMFYSGTHNGATIGVQIDVDQDHNWASITTISVAFSRLSERYGRITEDEWDRTWFAVDKLVFANSNLGRKLIQDKVAFHQLKERR